MKSPRPGFVAALLWLFLTWPAPIFAASAAVEASPPSPVQNTPATQSPATKQQGRGGAKPASRGESPSASGGRGSKPVLTALAGGPGQPGYVHYFLLTLPDESLETLVGIELPGRRIAWSFPDLGVVVAPLVEKGVVTAGGREYAVSHLYGIRPFPDDGAMDALRGQLVSRVERWVAAGTPYCENDGPRGACMSCLGFVLRVLYPGGRSDFPDLPADFRRALYAKSYSTEDLLLYLTGMMDLATREARLARVSQLDLPTALREDVLELVDAMEVAQIGTTATVTVPETRPERVSPPRPANVSSRPAQRKRL